MNASQKAANRWMSVLCYLGLSPILPPVWRGVLADSLHLQGRRAAALWGLHLAWWMLFLLLWVGLALLVNAYYPELIWAGEWLGLWIPYHPLVLLSVAGILLWFVGLGSVLIQLPRKIVLLDRLAAIPWVVKTGFYWNGLVLALLLTFAGLSLHAHTLVAQPQRPAKVYMLYHNTPFVPSWVLELGFYRTALASRQKWGSNAVAVLPISKSTLTEALQHGEVIWFSLHGYSLDRMGDFALCESIDSPCKPIGPTEVSRIGIGENLRLVYLGWCFGMQKIEQWKAIFAPAETAKSYPNISLYPEHLYWIWWAFPEKIESMEGCERKISRAAPR